MVRYLRRIAEKFPLLINISHSTGLIVWATKSYEIWLILQELLYLVRPRKLVEFGSGRSTHYIAEYALKFSAKMVSVEQHLSYCLRVNGGLKLSFLPSGVVKYVPIRGDWYAVNKVKRYLLELGGIDFLFVDGPTGLSRGKRNSDSFYDCVVPYLRDVKMAVIDDVQKEECNDMAKYLVRNLKLNRYDIKYSHNSTLAFLVNSDVSGKVSELPAYLRKLLMPVG